MRVHQQVVAIVVSMAAVGGEVWGGNRKTTKNGKKTKPSTTTTTVSAEGASDMDDSLGWQRTTPELSELTCQLLYTYPDTVQIDCVKKVSPNSPCYPYSSNGGDFYFEYDEYTSRNEGHYDDNSAPFGRHYYVELLMEENKKHTVKLGRTEDSYPRGQVTITAMHFYGAGRGHFRDTTEIPNSAFGGRGNPQIDLKYNLASCGKYDCNKQYGFSWCRSLERCTRPSDTEWSQPSDTGCPDTVDFVGWQRTTPELSELTCQLIYSDGIDKVQINCLKKVTPSIPCCDGCASLSVYSGGDFYFDYDEYTSRNEGYVEDNFAPFARHYYVELQMEKNKHVREE